MYCYPLTIADQHTRSLLAYQGLPSVKGVGVRPVFERLFREYGLPQAIRTDNGVPFATTGLHGLSQLNGWWRRLVETLMNWRSRATGIATGDQAIFATRAAFDWLRGFVTA